MNIISTFTYWESYRPTPRHRKLRWREVKGSTTATITEIKNNEAPIVFQVYDLYRCGDGFEWMDVRRYNKQLYKPSFFCDYCSGKARVPWPAEEMAAYIACRCHYNPGSCEGSYARAIQNINKYADRFLLIDGVVWEKCGEPLYCIYTFGLGRNHGGTCLSIDWHYNGNIPSDRYFNAMERDKAIATAKEIAQKRGDTEYVETIGKNEDIRVLDSSAVTRTPSIDHGSGKPFLNELESRKS